MRLRVVAAAIATGGLMLQSALHAEPAATDAGVDGALEPIVVTVQRREESAQSVGIALTVLPGSVLADKAITRVNDLQNAVPSLQIEPAFGSDQPQYRLRGVGFIDYTSNNTSPVGVSVDGVAFAFPIQTEGQLFDLSRVEVLSGPQGTLYGRNTTGGVINFITNQPTEETHAGVTAAYGSHDQFDAEGYVSGTLADGLTGRLSAAGETGGAWQRDRDTGRMLGNKDKFALRGQLLWHPVESVNVHVGVHVAEDKSDETGLQLIAPYTPTNGGAGGPVIPADTSPYVTGWSLNPAFAKIIGIAPDSKLGLDNSNDGADLTAEIDFGGAKLTSLSAYNKLIRREFSDWDSTRYYDSDEYLRSDAGVFSEELHLASTGTGALGWVGGAYYSKENFDERFYSDFTDRLGGIALTSYGQDSKSLGVFGQANYRFTDDLKGIFGVREEHESRDLIDLSTGFLTPAVIPFTANLNRSITSNLPSGKIGLDYQFSPDTLLYASISRGVKSGGFTAHNTVAAAQVDPFEPEKLTAYEIGIKSDVTPSLRINGAVYHYQYKDQQILTTVFDTVSQSYIGIFTNSNSRIDGAELELAWRPVAGLTLSQYAGFVEGYYQSPLTSIDQAGATGPVDFDGRPLSFPKWSYGGDLAFAWSLGGYRLTAESNYSFHDTYSQFFLLGSSEFTIPNYWLANANLSLSPASGAPWTVTLWGRNIFDKAYDTTRNFFLPGTDVGQAGEPTTVGIRVSYRY
jgi:outer membrane receptor protein involved in Fe transport